MIHYHGTPMSGTKDEAARFFAGRHALVPFPRPEQLPAVAEFCQSFVFDNGAYSVWKRGGVLDVAGYTKWAEDWHLHPGFDWALIPDVIDGDAADNDAMLADWPRAIPGVPVWHMHEPVDRLIRLAHEWPRVALGSSGDFSEPNSRAWWGRMERAMDALCDEKGRPPCKLHGLKMMNPLIFSRIPLASADSTNATTKSVLNPERFGTYLPATASQRSAVVADRVERSPAAAAWCRIAPVGAPIAPAVEQGHLFTIAA